MPPRNPFLPARCLRTRCRYGRALLGLWLSLASVLTACAPEAPVAPPEAPVTVQAPAGPTRLLTAPTLRAAGVSWPLGMLNVRAVTTPQGTALSHARPQADGSPNALDLWLTARSGARSMDLPTRLSESPAGRGRWLLAQGQVEAEVSSSRLVALHRWQLEAGRPMELLLQLPSDQLKLQGALTEDRSGFSGTLLAEERSLHVALEFDQFADAWRSTPAGGAISFQPAQGQLRFKLAFSTVSEAAARRNLEDLSHWDLALLAEQNRSYWDALLNRVQLTASESMQQAFYASLYRLLAWHGDITDVDGRYRAADGLVRPSAEGVGFIGNLNPAGTFRAAAPLLGMLAPEQLETLAYTLVAQARAVRGPAGASSWGAPVGEPATEASAVLLAGALARGVNSVTAGEALTPLLKDWTLASARWQETPPTTRGLAALGVDALGELARRSGEVQLAAAFQARAALQRQLGSDDIWLQAQHDFDGVLLALDGRDGLARRLRSWFLPADPAAWPWVVSFQHVPWLYMQSSQPQAGDQVLHRLWSTGLSPRAQVGQEPEQWAWTCFAILGLYPVTPQRGDYYWSTPLAQAARLQLADGLLMIKTELATGAADGSGRRLLLNGTEQVSRSLTHRQLTGGGVLDFQSTALAEP